MITTLWDQINESTLQALCDDGASESGTLEFKRQPPDTQGRDISNELAKDVCALANANGGDIVYGIAEVRQVADHLVPISGEPPDALMRRMREVIDNHVEPRITGIRFKDVALERGDFALVMRVPRSFDGPHLFRYKQQREGDRRTSHFRFVLRSDTLIQDMDYSQLRDAFGRTATLVERASGFRQQRLTLMEQGHLMPDMAAGPKICLHLVPLSGLVAGQRLDIAEVYGRTDINFAFAGGSQPQKLTNLDGLLLTAAAAGPSERGVQALARLFRSGAMEYIFQAFRRADPGSEARGPYIPAVPVTEEIRRVCGQMLDHARLLGLQGPAIIGLTVVQATGHRFEIVVGHREYGHGLADRGLLTLPDQWVEELGTPFDIDLFARPMLNALWQCFHEVRCHHYDVAGQWGPPV